MAERDVMDLLPPHLAQRAVDLDAQDRLAALRDEFVPAEGVVAYLDGNSLGRPLEVTAGRLRDLVEHEWGDRLIRSWDERWMDRPTELGDAIGRVALGAGPGQTVVADSTTVLLYKLMRALVAARPGRTEIVADTENFPTNRFVVAAVAQEAGLSVRWISPDPRAGVRAEEVAALLSERTAMVSLSHVAYKSAFVADVAAITAAAHAVGALVLWDLCHSVGAVPTSLDEHDVDVAVGCSYKYLNGGPGAPAFAYVAGRLQDGLHQPITGWMGADDVFAMGPTYQPAPGVRRFLSGTPPILGMLPVEDMVALVERAGLAAVREKSTRLTGFAIELADEVLAPSGVGLASPREADLRGSHVSLEHPDMREAVAALWERGVVPDFRFPHGLRAGLSPLSTGFVEVATAIAHVADVLATLRGGSASTGR